MKRRIEKSYSRMFFNQNFFEKSCSVFIPIIFYRYRKLFLIYLEKDHRETNLPICRPIRRYAERWKFKNNVKPNIAGSMNKKRTNHPLGIANTPRSL